jgi:hypothetical protein
MSKAKDISSNAAEQNTPADHQKLWKGKIILVT